MNALRRMLALVTGALLIGLSLWWIPTISIPVPRYRTGTYADYVVAVEMFLGIHGGVLLGLVVHWLIQKRAGQKMNPIGIFKAGVIAELCISLAFVLGSAVYGLISFGSLEKASGNLWGAVVILWLILGTLVAAALALLCYGFFGRGERMVEPN